MKLIHILLLMFYMAFSSSVNAGNYSFHYYGNWGENKDCQYNFRPVISFVEVDSIDLEQQPPVPIGVKGKLKIPVRFSWDEGCILPGKNLPAVVILHGSAGVDSRGDFYARALNRAGIATLEIDMWEARNVKSLADRPSIPTINLPDAFAALKFLSENEHIDPDRIGVMGFSWGGVVTMASAMQRSVDYFSNGIQFAAHIAHYPECYAYNNPRIPGSTFSDLTGAPILIQIGDKDDYDEGADACIDMKNNLSSQDKKNIRIIKYKNTFHGWDRLEVPTTAIDPFSHLGAGGEVRIVPDVKKAYKSRKRVVWFFKRHL